MVAVGFPQNPSISTVGGIFKGNRSRENLEQKQINFPEQEDEIQLMSKEITKIRGSKPLC